MRIRTLTAIAVTGVALAAAGCGEDNENADPSSEPDAPVNTDTPSADPEGSTPAPNEDSPQGESGGGY